MTMIRSQTLIEFVKELDRMGKTYRILSTDFDADTKTALIQLNGEIKELTIKELKSVNCNT
jgi:hypothetical protein